MPPLPASAANTASKAANTANIISSAGEVAGMAITVIGGINDANLRRRFSQNLDLLTIDQKKALNEALLDISSESERQKLIASVLTDLSLKRIDIITNNSGKAERTSIIVGAAIFGVIALGIIAIVVIKKK